MLVVLCINIVVVVENVVKILKLSHVLTIHKIILNMYHHERLSVNISFRTIC